MYPASQVLSPRLEEAERRARDAAVRTDAEQRRLAEQLRLAGEVRPPRI